MKKCKVLVSVMLTLALTACGGAGEQGPEGKQGPQGLQGDAGSDGKPGSDGEGCYVVKKDADHGIVICPADGSSYVIYSPENLPKANGLPNGNGGYLYCNAGYFGKNCAACSCEHGTCNDGLNGNGECSCAKGYTGNNCQFKAMTDKSGNVYKTVVIGEQTWMGENMAYQGAEVTCYANTEAAPNGDPDFIEHYGCLYTWEDAQKVCPVGWHLPIKDDFDALTDYVSNNRTTSDSDFLALAAAVSWSVSDTTVIGNDEFGFGALPSGYRAFIGGVHFDKMHVGADFWSETSIVQTVGTTNITSYWALRLDEGEVRMVKQSPNMAFSVRCLKD